MFIEEDTQMTSKPIPVTAIWGTKQSHSEEHSIPKGQNKIQLTVLRSAKQHCACSSGWEIRVKAPDTLSESPTELSICQNLGPKISLPAEVKAQAHEGRQQGLSGFLHDSPELTAVSWRELARRLGAGQTTVSAHIASKHCDRIKQPYT